MIFSLDVRRARKGDCLLLHYGTKTKPRLMLIDGGPSDVYKPHLEPRIQEIRKKRKLADLDSLTVDHMMVSHVDDDHIRGLIDLTGEEIVRQDAHEPLLLNVLNLWHNSFDAVINHTPDELTASLTKQFGAAATKGAGLDDAKVKAVEDKSKEGPEVVRGTLQVLASIEQGFRLRGNAKKLGYGSNSEFGGALVMATKNNGAIDLDGSLKVTVVGPMQPELKKLHEKHQEWLKEMKKKGTPVESALAAYVDRSVPNLSSIVVLAEADGKRMLLTGDARGDKILKGLEFTGVVKKDGTLEVDLLKVPHHGSSNNLDDDFFERVVADHYVFSGNGEHGNPERESLEMLFKARGKDPFTVHLTYPIDEIDVERKKDWEKERAKEQAKKKKNPKTKVRPKWSAEKNSLESFFDDLKLASGQKIKIVDKTKAHVINLLDAF